MSTQYLALASLGKNHWWRYLLGFLLIAVFWQIIGAIPLGILIVLLLGDEDPTTNIDLATLRVEGVDSIWSYLAHQFHLACHAIGLVPCGAFPA